MQLLQFYSYQSFRRLIKYLSVNFLVLIFCLPVASSPAFASAGAEVAQQNPIAQTEDQALSPQSPYTQPLVTVTTEILVGLRTNELHAAGLQANLVANLVATLAAITGVESVVSVDEFDTRGVGSVSCDDSSVAGLRIRVAAGDPGAIAATLSEDPGVLFAVPNDPVFAANRTLTENWYQQTQQVAEPQFEIDDPLYAEQLWYMSQVNAKVALEEVFNAQNADASDALAPVVVAIIDSGIDANHPEFTGRLLQGYNFLRPTDLPQDDYGHGTHVAGLIGAAVNNGVGIAGTSPNVMILPYKTLDKNGGGTIENVVKAICRAVDEGADIINLSLTSPSQNTDQYTSPFDYARDHGVMMIAAAGNSRQTRNMWPARLPDVMAIAATNVDGEWASYSSPGDSIDMAAPGGEFDMMLLSTWSNDIDDVDDLCKDPIEDSTGATYCGSIGTSMSAALVSGVAAVLKGFHPEATATEIREMLTSTAQPLMESSDGVGRGILDAGKAVVGSMSSQLNVEPISDTRVVPLTALPFTVDVAINNPSFEIVEWRASAPIYSWLNFSPSGGTTRFGQISNLSINITPTELPPGDYDIPITIVGKRPDETLLFQNVQILFRVDSEPDPNGQLIVSKPVSDILRFSDRSEAVTTTVEFINIGNEQLTWTVELGVEQELDEPWISFSSSMTGTIDYLEPVQLTLKVMPRRAATGQNAAKITLSAERGDGSLSTATTSISVDVVPSTLFPLILYNSP